MTRIVTKVEQFGQYGYGEWWRVPSITASSVEATRAFQGRVFESSDPECNRGDLDVCLSVVQVKRESSSSLRSGP